MALHYDYPADAHYDGTIKATARLLELARRQMVIADVEQDDDRRARLYHAYANAIRAGHKHIADLAADAWMAGYVEGRDVSDDKEVWI